MTVQTSYSNKLPEGYEGDIYSDRLTSRIDGQSQASAPIPYGRAVVYDSENTVRLIGATGEKIAGISTLEVQAWRDNGVIQYNLNDDVNILKEGVIRMRTSDALIKGDAVSIRHTDPNAGANPATLVGMLTATPDANADLWDRAEVMVGAPAGGLAVITVNMP